MKKSRFSEEQIIGILEEQQAELPVAEVNLHRPPTQFGDRLRVQAVRGGEGPATFLRR